MRRPGRLHRGGASEIPDEAIVDVRVEPEDPQSPIVQMSYKQAKKEVFHADSYP